MHKKGAGGISSASETTQQWRAVSFAKGGGGHRHEQNAAVFRRRSSRDHCHKGKSLLDEQLAGASMAPLHVRVGCQGCNCLKTMSFLAMNKQSTKNWPADTSISPGRIW